mmetsp:Transcript_95267/g.171987  ORF Transcript_95267/g.171987 Transcript_95267/m.171987 type:complete len:231 (-) Transcript_95267:173-865(-)
MVQCHLLSFSSDELGVRLGLSHFTFLRCGVSHELVDLGVFQRPEDDFAFWCPLHHAKLETLCRGSGSVHGLHQHFGGELQGLLGLHSWLPVLPQGLHGCVVVDADGVGLPAAEVAGGIGVVELEAVGFVVASDQEGHAERPQAAELCVALLVVADGSHELFHGHALAEGVDVLRRCKPELVDQDVCIRRDAGHGAKHGSVELEELLMLLRLVQQLGSCLLFAGEDDAVFC